MRTKIKICGLFRDCDIDYANAAGPDYIGFILDFPKIHRSISPEKAAGLRKRLLPGIRCAGVFVDQKPEKVHRTAEQLGLDVIQLHGREDETYIAALRERTDLPIWKAFKAGNAGDLEAALSCSADEILLDNGYGTGAAFDWSLLADFPRPFILAGGLAPENIPKAIRLFHPKVLDISSGVETDRIKDRGKMMAAVRAARFT